jgi:hypothetical protein
MRDGRRVMMTGMRVGEGKIEEGGVMEMKRERLCRHFANETTGYVRGIGGSVNLAYGNDFSCCSLYSAMPPFWRLERTCLLVHCGMS